jgi:hypothetical protein
MAWGTPQNELQPDYRNCFQNKLLKFELEEEVEAISILQNIN